jgi:hypothetical protein
MAVDADETDKPEILSPAQETALHAAKAKAKAKAKVRNHHTKEKEKTAPPRQPSPNGTRQPKIDPCSYCGGASHNARNCYKRLADEKGNATKVHKQANQNLLIDETIMEFSQSVLSINNPEPSPDHHTVDWGENWLPWQVLRGIT